MENYDFLLTDQLCFSAYSLSKAFVNQYKSILDPYSLTYPQYMVLLCLWENPRQNVQMLGEQLNLDSGTLSPMLKRMEKNGYLTRRRNPEDERQILVEITDKSINIKDELQRNILECFSLLNLSKEEYLELLNQLKTLTKNIGGLKNEKIIRNKDDKWRW